MDTAVLAEHSFIDEMGLTSDEVAVVADVSEVISVDAETIIFREGDTADAVYLTTSGRVKIATLVTQKLEKVLYTVAPDSVFGEMGLLDEGMRSATAQVHDSGEIIRIPRDDFLRVLASDAELGLKLVRGLYSVVIERLRLMDTVYAENIRWGLEVSGATMLDFSELLSGDTLVEIAMSGGEHLKGRIVKVAETANGLELTLSTADKIYIVPYGSVSFITFGKNEDFSGE